MDGWMDDEITSFLAVFQSHQGNKSLCAMESRFMIEKITAFGRNLTRTSNLAGWHLSSWATGLLTEAGMVGWCDVAG